MNKHSSIYAALGAALLITTLTACGDDGNDTDGSTGQLTTTTPMTTTDSTTTTGSTTDNPTTTDPQTTNPMTTEPETTTPMTTDPETTTPTTDGTTDPTTDGTTGDPAGYVFMPDDPEDYTQIDRHGAVEAGTAGIAAAQGLGFKPGSDIKIRDAYNASNPVEDAAAVKWLPEIAKSIMFFHDALDDDIEGFGLEPATFDETVMQAGPVIIPDTIKYDPSVPTAYPNGRKLEDPVVDLTLAAVLLKLGPNQPLDTFAKLPLNPPKNDVPFLTEFPFLAPPHAP